MSNISLGADTSSISKTHYSTAQDLGWLDDLHTPTPYGYCVSDSCREYRFWRERDQKLPFQATTHHLELEAFRNKSVIEVGCGMGVNLMTIGRVAKDVTGVEPVEIYRQMSDVFCEKERLSPLDIIPCSSEAIAADNERYDVVLCTAAHHYFDIVPAFSEISRILKPDGEVLVIGGPLQTYLRTMQLNKSTCITLLNTFSYMLMAKRLVPPKPNTTTGRPIYPSTASLSRWMRLAGLSPIDATQTGGDWCVRGRKPSR